MEDWTKQVCLWMICPKHLWKLLTRKRAQQKEKEEEKDWGRKILRKRNPRRLMNCWIQRFNWGIFQFRLSLSYCQTKNDYRQQIALTSDWHKLSFVWCLWYQFLLILISYLHCFLRVKCLQNSPVEFYSYSFYFSVFFLNIMKMICSFVFWGVCVCMYRFFCKIKLSYQHIMMTEKWKIKHKSLLMRYFPIQIIGIYKPWILQPQIKLLWRTFTRVELLHISHTILSYYSFFYPFTYYTDIYRECTMCARKSELNKT